MGFAYSFFGVLVGPQYSFDRYNRFVCGEYVATGGGFRSKSRAFLCSPIAPKLQPV